MSKVSTNEGISSAISATVAQTPLPKPSSEYKKLLLKKTEQVPNLSVSPKGLITKTLNQLL
jgi:hypothetical protein